jgi:hypothetical protein
MLLFCYNQCPTMDAGACRDAIEDLRNPSIENTDREAVLEEPPLNTFRPVLVLVPSSLSRQQSGLGTSTNTIFISLLKKSIGSIGFRFVPLDSSMFLVSETMIVFFPTLIRA